MAEKNKRLTQDDILAMLGKIYDSSLQGIPKVSVPIDRLANDYLSKGDSVDEAAKSFIKYQIAKCATSGFITSFGGFITMSVTIPANIGSVIYVQMRMIACLAYMGGYDINCDQVQTLIYACLAGVSVDHIVKNVGVQFGVKFANAMVKKIPGSVLTKINQKVGFRFLTKFGTKGLINIGRMVPVVGAVVGGGFDFVETKIIANRAYKMFIQGDFSTDPKDKTVIEIDDSDIVE